MIVVGGTTGMNCWEETGGWRIQRSSKFELSLEIKLLEGGRADRRSRRVQKVQSAAPF